MANGAKPRAMANGGAAGRRAVMVWATAPAIAVLPHDLTKQPFVVPPLMACAGGHHLSTPSLDPGFVPTLAKVLIAGSVGGSSSSAASPAQAPQAAQVAPATATTTIPLRSTSTGQRLRALTTRQGGLRGAQEGDAVQHTDLRGYTGLADLLSSHWHTPRDLCRGAADQQPDAAAAPTQGAVPLQQFAEDVGFCDDKPIRPPSPPRPGVYVGHVGADRKKLDLRSTRFKLVPLEAPEEPAPVLPLAGAENKHINTSVSAGKDFGKKNRRPGKNGKSQKPSNYRVAAPQEQVPPEVTQEDMSEFVSAEENEEFNKWKRRVKECARSLQAEVNRFRFDR